MDNTAAGRSVRTLRILDCGSCEPFKAAVHIVALGLFGLMGSYNAAAWMRRRQRHLAVNAVLYLSAVIWEQRHVAHHLAACAAVSPAQAQACAPAPETFELENEECAA